MGVIVPDQDPKSATLIDVVRQIHTTLLHGPINRADWDHGPSGVAGRSSKHIWIWGARVLGYIPKSGMKPPTYHEAWDALMALHDSLSTEVEIKWKTHALPSTSPQASQPPSRPTTSVSRQRPAPTCSASSPA